MPMNNDYELHKIIKISIKIINQNVCMLIISCKAASFFPCFDYINKDWKMLEDSKVLK